jgi:hypothetical protein
MLLDESDGFLVMNQSILANPLKSLRDKENVIDGVV